MSSRRTYEVVLYHGSQQPELDGVSAVIKVDADEPGKVISALAASGITPADLRARTLFLTDEFSDHRVTLSIYAALCGFAGRRLDFSTGAGPTNAASLHHAGVTAEDAGRPENPAESVTVGVAYSDEPSVDPSRPLEPETVSLLRYARRAILRPTGRGNTALLTQFVVNAAIRVRNGAEHFPALGGGDGDIVELDLLRREGSELRRSIHTDVRDALVPSKEVTPRQRTLNDSSTARPMEDVLVMLGSHQDPESGFWRCTRPNRHRNGDANPSMRVIEGKIRCYRCDTEPVDPLRLVIDTLDVSPDAAADLLNR
jgi:hypothetical protein